MIAHQLSLQVATTRFSRPHLPAFLAVAAIVMGTMIFPFSMMLFSHVLAAGLLFIAFYLISQIKIGVAQVSAGNTFAIGILCGMAIITEYPTTIPVVALVIFYFYAVWIKAKVRNLWVVLLPALGGLIPISIQLAYNLHNFGSLFATGYTSHANAYFQQEMVKGLMGIHLPSLKVLFYMTVHPAMGIFWQSPVLVMSFLGLVYMARNREYRPEALLTGAIIISMLLLISGYYMWWGGSSFAPRHLVPMLPFLMLPLLFIPKKLIFPTILLGIISVVQMIMIAMVRVDSPSILMEMIDRFKYFEYSVIYSIIIPQFLEQHFTTNIGTILHLQGYAAILPIVFFLVGFLTAILFVTLRSDKNMTNRKI
jgi:hypothetical protein